MNYLLSDETLLVFALESEAAGYFKDRDVLFTGIGKLNAGYHLLKRIVQKRPGMIVNLGSAGSAVFKKGEVVCCTRFIQRDMDVTPLGFAKYETPFCEQDVVLQYGFRANRLPEGTCGTGDNFEIQHNGNAYDVIDMEAFALAWVARQEQIPFVCLKYISDGADGKAADDWAVSVHQAAVVLHEVMKNGIVG
ncbi:MAG: hypothetical protein KIT80_16445 [Chitinophagaceae bacterium]|nr:hypothetical protein [Chitinophagaceae bacterium]MCW5928508.1 hypothetical protein [Chitinophagaceae bacterium]